MTTIHVSEKTRRELRKVEGQLMTMNGKERTVDDLIQELIKHWNETKTPKK